MVETSEAGQPMLQEPTAGSGDQSHEEPPTASKTVAVLGAGPAGLTAAYELLRNGNAAFRPIVYEMGDRVGGISRTEVVNGYRFDIGGHRFFTKVPEVEQLWDEVLGEDFITVPRLSRIFYRGRFFQYPLKISNALYNLGAIESLRVMLSYLRWQLFPSKREATFEEWVVNRFGRRLYTHFFETYTEKVWGIPASEIRADWAAQRIKNLTLFKAIWHAISGANSTVSLIEKFRYPRLGPGMMWEKTAELVKGRGGAVHLGHEVVRINRTGRRVTSVDVRASGRNETQRVDAECFINSLALRDAVLMFDPPPPPDVVAAAKELRYRDFLIVTLVLDRPDPFPDNWIYIHSPDVKVGRIQNFRAWSSDMVPDPETASIGMEYFCQNGDGLWTSDDLELQALAAGELEKIGLARAGDVVGSAVIRQPKAYPVYDQYYKAALETIQSWLAQLDNFQTIGRNGLHRYNNQDHSMLTALYAVDNLMGAHHDVWNVNLDRSYHEEFEVQRGASGAPRRKAQASRARKPRRAKIESEFVR